MKNEELAEFILGEKNNMVNLMFEPKNRASRRAAEKELNAILKHLSNTEGNFLTQLFDESNGLSYDELYQFYNNQYTHNVEYSQKNNNFKFIEINKLYFSQTYKSII